MDMRFERPIIGGDDCGCCYTGAPDRDGHGEGYGCHQKATVLTNREETILGQIRGLSRQAQGIKAKLQQLNADSDPDEAARAAFEEELANLRQRRSALEVERIAAAEERMRILGHA